MGIFGSTSDLLNQNWRRACESSFLISILKWFQCTLKLESHWCKKKSTFSISKTKKNNLKSRPPQEMWDKCHINTSIHIFWELGDLSQETNICFLCYAIGLYMQLYHKNWHEPLGGEDPLRGVRQTFTSAARASGRSASLSNLIMSKAGQVTGVWITMQCIWEEHLSRTYTSSKKAGVCSKKKKKDLPNGAFWKLR